jgi:hypothetical protein
MAETEAKSDELMPLYVILGVAIFCAVVYCCRRSIRNMLCPPQYTQQSDQY